MGRLFAIDYGRKRIGIAVSDETQIIANALTTVPAHQIFDFIKGYLVENEVECFVVGLPVDMAGKPSESSQYIEPFVKKLKKLYPNIPVYRVDERLTSVLAHDAILMSGAKKTKRQDKALVDRVSATIILQSFMENPQFYKDRS